MFLTKMNARIKRFMKRKDGASAIEYAILVTMVAIVLVTLGTTVGDSVKTVFNNVITALKPASTGTGGTGGTGGS